MMVNSYVVITYELFQEIERKRGAVKKYDLKSFWKNYQSEVFLLLDFY